jgi:hypothetical protein
MTVVFGIVCMFFLPDTPAATTFLSHEQKEWALLRMQIDARGSTTAAAVDGVTLASGQSRFASRMDNR